MESAKLGLALFFITLLYVALLAAGNLFIYQQQKQTAYTEFEDLKTRQLNVLSDLTQEGLINQNYAFVEWSFNRWGNEYDNIVSISLENTSGYALIQYQRAVPARDLQAVAKKRIVMHDDTYLLKISTDTIEIERKLEELLLQLFLIATGATVLLIVLLWVVYFKYAMQPLSEEVKRRKAAEDRLADIPIAD